MFCLYDPQIYRHEIQRLVQKHTQAGRGYDVEQQGVPVVNFGFDQKKLAKYLAKSIKNKTYQLGVPQQRTIFRNQKNRLVYDYSLTDQIVIKVFTHYLEQQFKPLISSQLYSFQKGKKAYGAARDFGRYVLSTRKRTQKQGLYVLKIDLQSYGKTIPLGQSSPLWERLKPLTQLLTGYEQQLVQQIIRPTYVNDKGRLQCNLYGITDGVAISNFIGNFYCAAIDELFQGWPNLFYARYGDDILLCHPQRAEILRCKEQLELALQHLQLQVNPTKSLTVYLSPAGHRGESNLIGSNALDYLGYRIDGYGRMTLSEKRKRMILLALKQRIVNLNQVLKTKPVPEHQRVKMICQMVNQALTSSQFMENQIQALLLESNDRSQLKHLDYLIALNIAMSVTSIQGVQAFSRLSYRQLRTQFELCSLVQLKNEAAPCCL